MDQSLERQNPSSLSDTAAILNNGGEDVSSHTFAPGVNSTVDYQGMVSNFADTSGLDPLYDREDLFQTNQRILDIYDNNKYHVTRGDFQSPKMYQLNLLKPN